MSHVYFLVLPLSVCLQAPIVCSGPAFLTFNRMPNACFLRACRHLEAARPGAPNPVPLASFAAPTERARYTRPPPEGLVVLQVREGA